MTVNVFAVPIFFVCFRECLESTIVISVLLSFLKQAVGPDKDPAVYKKLRRQVWAGVGFGLAICLCIGGAFIGVYYGLGKDLYSNTEDLWEGIFSLVAALIITIMGAALLRISKLQDKWRVKLVQALEDNHTGKGRFKRWAKKYFMFWLPFITVLREGLEAIIFIGGVSLGIPATAFPLAVACGLLAGLCVGYLIYKGGNRAPLQLFLIASTCFLYLVAAGLLSKGVWGLEVNAWNHILGSDTSDVGSGPGSYDIRQSVWHVNCCNAEIDGGGGWGIFNAILGWENSATYGSVISYNLYWVFVMILFWSMRYNEKHGHWPLMPKKKALEPTETSEESVGGVESSYEKKGDLGPTVRELDSASSRDGRPLSTSSST